MADSTLTWLAYSDAERRRALQVVELLGQSETRDELGLGVIRDGFAEALFPGVSTVQRRARYFLFVPWIFRDVERRFAGRADLLGRTRGEELRLVEVLLNAGEEDGVIGARARRRLRQLPSTIYWQGLSRWGIRRVGGTREQWARSARRATPQAVDDDGQVDSEVGSWWHSALPDPPNDWPRGATLALGREEADYLRERIADRCAGTLLAVLAEREMPWKMVEFPWQLELPGLAAEQRRVLDLARQFSEVMHGAALVYNHELAIATDDEERTDEYRAELEVWAEREELADRRRDSIRDMWELLRERGSRHSVRTETFVNAWMALARQPDQVITTPAVDLVRQRERQVKKTQARLSYDAARDTWRGAAGAGQLDYRWSSTQRQLLDIVGAES